MKFALSSETEFALKFAQNSARSNSQSTFGPGHILAGILHDDAGLRPILDQLGKDVHRLRNWANFRIENHPKSTQTVETPSGDEAVQRILQEADKIRQKEPALLISPRHLLEAICTPEVGFTASQLQHFPISYAELTGIKNIQANSDALQNSLQSMSKTAGSAANNQALSRFCQDLTSQARHGKIDPVLGRNRELKELLHIIGKRNSPNVLLLGEPGVGKTALVGGLALSIVQGEAPAFLKDASIFEIDINGSLVAGAYKGEVEERMKSILQAVKTLGKAILFIDEIHALLDDKGSIGSGLVNLMKPELARGEILLIGATTHAEYKKYIEKDFAFARRFTQLIIEEPKEEEAVEMVQGLVPRYAKFHGLDIEAESVKQAVYLAKRYIMSKRLPVSAIELVDLAMSALRVMNETSSRDLDGFQQKLDQAQSIEDEEEKGKQLHKLLDEMKEQLSFLLLQENEMLEKLEEEKDPVVLFDTLQDAIAQFKTALGNPKTLITADDIAATVSAQSGIPLGKIKSSQSNKWLQLEESLGKRVVGQEQALSVVAKALRRSRAGLKEDNESVGAFFFTGPTGTGKTELAKTIAEFLFDDEAAMIRFDMSEYMQSHSVETLLGAPAGFVGHEEGGILVNKIRQKPYSVVLFDEIEKAHPDVYKIFLQMLEEGKLTDRLGKLGDFTKSVIVFTSNAGSEWIEEAFNAGKTPSENEVRQYLMELRDAKREPVFRREFLHRRLKIVPFAPLGEPVAKKILNIQLKRFADLMAKQGIGLEVSESAEDWLFKQGYNRLFGARPLREVIKDQIGAPAADMIIAGELGKGEALEVSMHKDGENLLLQNKKPLNMLKE